MKKILVVQITALVVVSALFVGMLFATPVYSEVYEGIVQVLCLSCLKLQPKTTVNFSFNTVDSMSHPDFVVQNLSQGVVFLHYSGDSCLGCDIMYPVIKELFSVEFGKQDMFSTTVRLFDTNITFIYINIHHTTERLRASQRIYDTQDVQGIPMFTVVTLGYDHGDVKPFFATLYGTLGKGTNEERRMLLSDVVRDAVELYHQNRVGFHH
ncbi:MAG: hypothetical protein QXL17_02480 [Candidatus Thermoplasmatota archaeon]